METRFPISADKGHVNLSFSWCDAFKPQKKTTQSNLHFEKAAVLYNLAAVQCQQALAADRSSDDGIKLACHLFQMAAGACAHLRDGVGLKVRSHPPQT
jgi:programmed cell death 6-interacting protein